MSADMGTPVTLKNHIIHKLWGIDYDKNSEFVDDLRYPKCVYHYTSRDAAVAITDTLIASANGKSANPDLCGFAFSNYLFLNDNREYELGIKFANDWVPKLKNVPRELTTEILKQVEEKKELFAPYVLSLCQKQDSTSQWQIYTPRKDGGYAIGLNVSQIEDAVDRFNEHARDDCEQRYFAHGSAVMFMPCIYCSPSACDKTLARCKNDESTEENLLEALGLFFDGITDHVWDDKGKVDYSNCAQWCAMRICQFASFLKSDDFRHEEEWRLVLHPKFVQNKDVRIIAGKPMITPLSLNLGNCIEQVVVSPHGDRERLMLLAKFQTERAGINIIPKESDSPYNGR